MSNITASEFVTIWQTSKDLREVMKRTSMEYFAIQRCATSYRKKGIELKYFRRGSGEALDVDALNELAKSLRNGSKDE